MHGTMRTFNRAIRGFRRDEAGLSLIEMLVSILILGIALSAFAGLLIATIRATGRNERTVTATALAQEVVEEMQAVTWDDTALYPRDVDELAADDEARWEARLASGGELDGSSPIWLPDYVDASVDRADAPYPSDEVVRHNVTFQIDRYVTWIDRDGNGADDTRRLTAFVRWDDPQSGLTELRFDSEKAPTRDDVATTPDGLRVLYFVVTPDPNEVNAAGTPQTTISVHVKTNLGVINGQLTYEYVETTVSADEPPVTTYEVKEHTVNLTPGSYLDPGWSSWTATLPVSGGDPMSFFVGSAEFTFTGTRADDVTDDVSETRIVNFYGDAVTEGEARGGSPDPTPTDTPTTAPPTWQTAPAVSAVCINSANNQQKLDVSLSATAKGIGTDANGDADGTLLVDYTYRQKNGNTISEQFTNGQISMTATVNPGQPTAYKATISSGGSTKHYWKAGDVVDFVFVLTRDSDGQQITATVSKTVSATC